MVWKIGTSTFCTCDYVAYVHSVLIIALIHLKELHTCFSFSNKFWGLKNNYFGRPIDRECTEGHFFGGEYLARGAV